MTRAIEIRTKARSEMLNITNEVKRIVKESGIKSGICYLYIPHTTAGILINEDADPDVAKDIINALEKTAPYDGDYRHSEGNAAAHIKASLIGSSGSIPIEEGSILLGRWQGIFFCEFDGPRPRRVIVKLIEG